jgi:hypothetical protein
VAVLDNSSRPCLLQLCRSGADRPRRRVHLKYLSSDRCFLQARQSRAQNSCCVARSVNWLMPLGRAGIWSWRRVVTHRVVNPSYAFCFHHKPHLHLHPFRLSNLATMASSAAAEQAWPAHKVRKTFLTYFENLGHTYGQFQPRFDSWTL